MRTYVISLAVGLLVGVIYAVLKVRSPAPPVIALVGLFGMLLGEQLVPVAKRWLSPEKVTLGWVKDTCGQHVFGELPQAPQPSKPPAPIA